MSNEEPNNQEEIIKELQNQITSLKEELDDEKSNNSLDQIKEKYENVIEAKNKEIQELTQSNKLMNEKMDKTMNNLNDEVKVKLEQSEQLAELNKQVEELLTDKAIATVDKYITEGKILPAQRDTALKLCLKDNDTFLELYKDAKPLVETHQERRSIHTGKAESIAQYFKN